MSSVMRFDEWQDSEGNPVYDGSGGPLATPAILQVVSTTKTDPFSASLVKGVLVAVTGLTATITPTATTSKILISASISTGISANGAAFILKRDSTNIAISDAEGNRQRVTVSNFTGSSSVIVHSVLSVNHLDSPSTTSAITYGFDMRSIFSEATITGTVNRTAQDADTDTTPRQVSSITLMEVAG